MSKIHSGSTICPKREVRFGDAPLQRTRSDGQAFKQARSDRLGDIVNFHHFKAIRQIVLSLDQLRGLTRATLP